MAHITLKPGNHSYDTQADETLLDGALRAGISVPYGCRNGACGACKGYVAGGQVDHGNALPSALSDDEKAQGMTLLCCATPLGSEVVIEVEEVSTASGIPVRNLPCRVEKIERPADDVAILHLKLPASDRLQFLAGQYIDILLKDGGRRSFSLANAPGDDALLQLHVRHVAGGAFTDHVFGAMKPKEMLRIEGPHGSFYLREDIRQPMVLLASGTGFAPIKAIAEHIFQLGMTLPVTLYWGGRSLKDLYMRELPEAWAAEHPNFRFVPVLSEALPEDHWTGRTGFVHQAVLDDFASLDGYQVYACGAPVVVDSARKSFTGEKGLPEDRFFADAFYLSAGSK